VGQRPSAAQRESRLDDAVLCSGTLGKIPFQEKIDAAAAAGFAGISIYYRESGDPRQIRQALADADLFLAELDGPMDWLPEGCAPPAPSPAEVVDRAAALGARSLTVIEVTGEKPPLDLAVDAFAEICDLARQADVLVHIEPFPWSGISDFGFAAEIVAAADRPNGGILLDTWHLFRGPNHGLLPAQLDPARVLGLQINDVQATRGHDLRHEAMHGRLLPGAGAAAVDIRTMLSNLRDRGCVAPFGVEVFSDDLAAFPPPEIAERALEALRLVAPRQTPDAR
jgi:sugar phosphate isomerase/epimerase